MIKKTIVPLLPNWVKTDDGIKTPLKTFGDLDDGIKAPLKHLKNSPVMYEFKDFVQHSSRVENLNVAGSILIQSDVI